MKSITSVLETLFNSHKLNKEDCLVLLSQLDEEGVREQLSAEAVRLRRQYYGDKVFTRGLIEFTNICKNNCFYCGIRRDNANVNRYRLSKQEIMQCCKEGYALGFRTFVLQGGEDGFFTDDVMCNIISEIKAHYPEVAITLSLGEREMESYRRMKQAGADRYLLRHETANEAHYRMLHPDEMKLSNRKSCLYALKELGYQVGAGMMIGSPGQTYECLADDLVFLQELKPHMVGMGPFIPHKDTCFAKEQAGSVELTLAMLSIVRILLPSVLLPATTALGTLDPKGREKGLLAGCNVVMPNLSPVKNRKDYALYDNKICTGDESAQCIKCMTNRVEAAGFHLVSERGDSAAYGDDADFKY